jgi:hypothetical protein
MTGPDEPMSAVDFIPTANDRVPTEREFFHAAGAAGWPMGRTATAWSFLLEHNRLDGARSAAELIKDLSWNNGEP